MRLTAHCTSCAVLLCVLLHCTDAAKKRRRRPDPDGGPAGKTAKRETRGLTCSGFFTVLAEKEPWKTNGLEPCADTFGKLDPFLRALSAQMGEMGETLTVFTTYTSSSESCSLFNYPNLKLRHFDAVALMEEYDLGEVVDFFRQFTLQEYTRTSDVLRLLLAHKHALTYIDPDVHFVSYQKERFFKEFVGAAVWNEVQCSLEMTNCAFCLSAEPLESLIAFMKHRLLFGETSYLYAELGPAMFQKVLMNNYAVTLYSQNNPEQEVVQDVVAGIRKYNHSMLHVTSTIRLFLVENRRPNGGDVLTFLEAVRRGAGLKPLRLPPSGRTADHELDQYKAFIRNNYFDAKAVDAAGQFVQAILGVLNSYRAVHDGTATPENGWVVNLSPENSKEALYLECIEMYTYIMQSSEPSSPEHLSAAAGLSGLESVYSGMLDRRLLGRARADVAPVGSVGRAAIAESRGRLRRVQQRVDARGEAAR